MGWGSVPTTIRIPNVHPDLTAQVLKRRDCPSVSPDAISKTGTLIFYFRDSSKVDFTFVYA